MTNKYLTKDQASKQGWYCRADLRTLFRLKTAPAQAAAGEVWQGYCSYLVFDKAKCVPMRPYRKPTAKQLEALSQGRDLIGTERCLTCKDRFPPQLMNHYTCFGCWRLKRFKYCSGVVKHWINSDTVIVDTETSGLDENAEIVEISVIDMQGQVLMNTLIKPVAPIPKEATAIHGISDDDVLDAPAWSVVHERFCDLVKDREVLIYNASFDLRLIKQTAALHGMSAPDMKASCVMELYAYWHGDQMWNGEYRWQGLGVAAYQCDVSTAGAHRALADCLTTLGVIKHIHTSSVAPY